MSKIPLEKLEEMFQSIREKSKWDTDSDLLWGYFFTDPDPEKLKPIADRLATSGYRYVDIYETDDSSTWFLHVEKIKHIVLPHCFSEILSLKD